MNDNRFNACQLTRTDGKPLVISREKARRFHQAFQGDNDRVTILLFSDGTQLHVREQIPDAVRAIGRCVDGLRPEEPRSTEIRQVDTRKIGDAATVEIRQIDDETIEIFGTRYSVAVFQALGCDFPASVGRVLRVDKKQDGVVTVTRLPIFERTDPGLVVRASKEQASDLEVLGDVIDVLLRIFIAAANGKSARSLRRTLELAVGEWFHREWPSRYNGAPGDD